MQGTAFTYIIAFSSSEIVDVTHRYTLDKLKVPERRIKTNQDKLE